MFLYPLRYYPVKAGYSSKPKKNHEKKIAG
jgi:hypothetical protein